MRAFRNDIVSVWDDWYVCIIGSVFITPLTSYMTGLWNTNWYSNVRYYLPIGFEDSSDSNVALRSS